MCCGQMQNCLTKESNYFLVSDFLKYSLTPNHDQLIFFLALMDPPQTGDFNLSHPNISKGGGRDTVRKIRC